ncbi:hexokinase type 2 [Zeugodacus cucurbitae]|uniref:Phosphotransferase n=1 Tax=Zeugodacus cucurbitae TaxID=28588 RepID=A0A0A1WN07_ZEUCU|nr:hexokinase type 2 [Zeugodacus cucurbitae]
MEKDLNGAMQSLAINSSNGSGAIVNGCCRGTDCNVSGKLSCSSNNSQQQQQFDGCSSNLSNSQNNGHCVACKCGGSAQSADETDNVRVSGQIGNGAVGGVANVTSSFAYKSASAQQLQQLQQQQAQPQTPPPPYANASAAEKHKMVHELCQQLILTDEQIRELNYRILHEIKRGLNKDTHAKADVKCFITYVQDLPNGNERGKFLALDLGGTNFRVLLIHLKEEHDFQMESRIYAIPQHIMIGTGQQLFDHIAECLASFMSEHNVYKERLPLGFTFSFPLQQLGLTKGHLSTWTKGFNCSGVVGEDVVQLLKDAIARRGDVQIEICAILNDTTGTLMSCAWKNHNCKIGLIVGTGSNACYVERVEECDMFEGADNGKSHMLINTEWGALGNNGMLNFLRTEFDDEIDRHSINPGRQLFEKMISGMYMGELVRLVIVKLVKAGILFKGQDSDVLMTRGQFFTKYVSEIEADEPNNFTNCRMVLDELGLNDATDEDCANVRYVCECVSKRAAHLVSCGIATLINKMDEKQVTVGVDGSVYRFHPKFHTLMVEKITELIKPDISFDLMLSEDGSGRGAALVAAVACREDNVVQTK